MYLPPLTIKLLWATAISLLLPLLLPASVTAQMVLWPLGEAYTGIDDAGLPTSIGFMPWQLVTHVMLNSGAGQFLFIALTLAFFGSRLEAIWGERRYGLFLLACLIGSGLVQLLVLTVGSRMGWLPFTPASGASGVIFGILFACAYLNPRQRVMLIIPPIPLEMRILVAILVAMEMLFGVLGSPNGLAHIGFLGGMLPAWLHIQYWRGNPPFRRGPNLRRVK